MNGKTPIPPPNLHTLPTTLSSANSTASLCHVIAFRNWEPGMVTHTCNSRAQAARQEDKTVEGQQDLRRGQNRCKEGGGGNKLSLQLKYI